jgi:hypothetical protein
VIIGTLIYVARVEDPRFLYAVNEIACESTKATENTMIK